MTRRFRRLLACMALFGLRAAAAQSGPQENSDWTLPAPQRLVVMVTAPVPEAAQPPADLALPQEQSPPSSVAVRVPRQLFAPDGEPAVQVVAPDGRQTRVLGLHWRRITPETIEVLFPYQRGIGTYHLYLGAEGPAPVYKPPPEGVRVETYAWTPPPDNNRRGRDKGLPRHWVQMLRTFAERGARQGAGYISRLQTTENPYGHDDWYLGAYSAWLFCPREGTYSLSVDSDDAAFAVLDGRFLGGSGGSQNFSVNPFERTYRRELDAGFHHLLVYQAEGEGPQGVRIGWQPPGDETMQIIPKHYLRGVIPARVTALQQRDGTTTPYIRIREIRRYRIRSAAPVEAPAARYVAADAPTVAHLRLEATTPPAEGRRFEWSLLGRTPPVGPEADAYVRVGQPVEVQLTVREADGGTRTFSRRIAADPDRSDEAVTVDLYLEERSCPSLAYIDQTPRLFLSALNESEHDLTLEFLCQDPAGEAPHRQRLLLKGVDADKRRVNRHWQRTLECRLSGFHARAADDQTLHCTLGFPGVPLLDYRLRTVMAGAEWPRLNATDGHLRAPDGTRVLVAIAREDEAAHRRLAALREARAAIISSGKATLLYGDALQNSVDPDGRSSGLAAPLRQSLGEQFDHQTFAPGPVPALGGVAGIDAALEQDSFGRVILSPGLLDIRAGTPLPTFARALDAMIDRVQQKAPGAEVIIVGPPPEVGTLARSRRYDEAAAKVAAAHHLRYVNVHEALGADDADSGWELFFRDANVADRAHYPYPTRRGRRLILEALDP